MFEKANINPTTGIPYGLISANALHPDVVDVLMYGSQAIDLTYKRWEDEQRRELGIEAAERGLDHGSPDWENWVEHRLEARAELTDFDEVEVEGVFEGVHYMSTWLGGALTFFIMESPFTTERAGKGSICVPNCAILDSLDGGDYGYNVPDSWRDEENI